MQRFCATVGLLVLLASAFEIRRLTEAAKATTPRQSNPRKMEKLQATDTEMRRFSEALRAAKPRQSSPRKLEKLQAADTGIFSAATTCKNILKKKPNSPSGTYTVTTSYGDFISVYCEMGLHGGGYTFLTPMSLTSLTDAEIQAMFTDRTTFLLRVRMTNGTQPYAVLSQLYPEYSSIPLTMSLSSRDGFSPPLNKYFSSLEPPFLFFGFIPNANYSLNGTLGLTVNGNKSIYKNCHFALYTNFKEAQPQNLNFPDNEFLGLLLSQLLPNPSGRVIPSQFFFFGEMAFGGCGTYKDTNQLANITGFTIGFR